MQVKHEINSLVNSQAELGEAPIWSYIENRLYWVDIRGKNIHAYDPKTNHTMTRQLPDLVTTVALRKSGSLLVALRNQLHFFDFDANKLIPYADIEMPPTHRCSDGKCDRSGRFWIGTINSDDPKQPEGSLYSIQSDKRAKRILDKLVCTNGMGWSPDNRIFYLAETFTSTIFAYDFDLETGSLSNKRLFASTQDLGGMPDGLTVDSEGGVWCAVLFGSSIVRFDFKGNITEKINIPAPHVTNCCFGGEKLETLFITSLSYRLSEEEKKQYPLAGNLLSIEVNYRGIPETPFIVD